MDKLKTACYLFRFSLGKTAVYLLFIGVLIGCDGDGQSGEPVFEVSPRLLTSPDGSTPLAVAIEFTTTEPVKAQYSVRSDTGRVWDYQDTTFQKKHYQPLLNFAAGSSYDIEMSVVNEDGRTKVWSEPLRYSARSLVSEAGFPAIEKHGTLDGDQLVLLNLFRYEVSDTEPVRVDENYGLIIALDKAMNIVWSYESDNRIDSIEADTPSTLTLIGAMGRKTINFLGRPLALLKGDRQLASDTQQTITQAINADFLHSKQALLPNGNRLLLSTEMRIVEQYPKPPDNPYDISPLPPGAAGSLWGSTPETMVVGDVVVEISASGEVVGRWNLFNLLDVQRSSYHGYWPTYTHVYPANPSGTPRTWTQANAIAYDGETDTIIVSVMHQDAIIGINKTDGELKWILGDPGGWSKPWSDKVLKPASNTAFNWPYLPSSLLISKTGDLLVVDNGGYQAVPPNEPKVPAEDKQRVLVLHVDESAMSVSQRASYALQKWPDSQHGPLWSRQQFTPQLVEYSDSQLLVSNSYGGMLLEINKHEGSAKSLLSLSAATDKSQWGIADVTLLSKLQLAAEDRFPERAKPELEIKKQLAERRTSQASGDGLVGSNVDIPNLSIVGEWRLHIGEQAQSTGEKLVLQQEGSLITGEFAGVPVVAWVKGNTFNMVVRGNADSDQLRFRYRGVIDNDAMSITGTVQIQKNNQLVVQTIWEADRT